MKKATIGIIVLIIITTSAPVVANAFGPGIGMAFGSLLEKINPISAVGYFADVALGGPAKPVVELLLLLFSFLFFIVAHILDGIIALSIIDFSSLVGEGQVGSAIREGWTVLRDIANITFIFVLLYTAFKTMFMSEYSNLSKSIRNIILVALLINFSLFFTKVVIDASNVLATGFYNAIASSSTTVSSGILNQESFYGITPTYMNITQIHKIYNNQNANSLRGSVIVTTGTVNILVLIVTTIVFLIIAIMFISRFVILIFAMILSPFAIVSLALPGSKSYFDKWKDTVISQSFFAPIYFALTWVTFKVGFAITKGFEELPTGFSWSNPNPTGLLTILINYTIIIGLTIASLVLAKSIASKSVGFTAITGAISGATIGLGAIAGRQVLGRYANRTLNDSELRRKAAEGDKWAKIKLNTADKMASGSFDVRGIGTLSKIPGLGDSMGILGKAGGSGGFAKSIKDKADKEKKDAERLYGMTDEEKILLAKKQEEERATIQAAKEADEVKKKGQLDNATAEIEKREKETTQPINDEIQKLRKDRRQILDDLVAAQTANNKKEVESLRIKADNLVEVIKSKEEERKEIIEDMKKEDDYQQLLKSEEMARKEWAEANAKQKKKEIGPEEYSQETQKLLNIKKGQRQIQYAQQVENSLWTGGAFGSQGSIAAGRAIRKNAGGKTDEEQLTEIAKRLAKKETESASTPNSTSNSSTGSTTPSGTPPKP